MEPNTTNQSVPSFDLPQPNPSEMGGGVNPNMPVPETNQQTEVNNMELPSAPSPVPPPTATPMHQANPVAPAPAVEPPMAPTAVAPTVPAQDDAQLTAEDNDLIEKAWVMKAKAIVEQTKDDPYKQNKEINKVKASYIKKRYDKDIKLTEEPAQ